MEEVIVTGSRVTVPGVISSSPITSIDSQEISFQQEPNFEKILRDLPFTIPGDGASVNNGTAGQATIDLRGLGPERNLILMDGRRMTPYNYDGEVDVQAIPTALIERIDIITGGASAVYGSDAIAGAVNVILKHNFEGIEIDLSQSETSENDGTTNNLSITMGANVADGRGNVVLNLGWTDREQVLLGQRPLGLLGIDSEGGGGLAEFEAGLPPLLPETGCGGPNVVDISGGGSTTAIPTRFALVGYGAANAQFRDDGTIGTECSRFNFNPFNFYQTPQERFNATAVGHFDLTDDASVYANINFSNTTVDQQIAPSGTFGQPFMVPVGNAFLTDQARGYIIDAGNDALAAGALNPEGLVNWQDNNNNGMVDAADHLLLQLRRRTVELGPRSEAFDSDYFQFTVGTKGNLVFLDDWTYDLSVQYGESNLTTVRAGYTNLTNIQNALDSTDGINCANGDATCVPLNLFGGFGTITPAMAGYAQAIALQQQEVEQEIYAASFSGPVSGLQLPSANNPMTIALGYEHRKEGGSLNPDECLKLAPSSCQGGAGGNLLPIAGTYTVEEFFIEGFLPLVEGKTGAESLVLEYGFRTSDYTTVGTEDTWKVGLNWRPIDVLLVRVMGQQASRAPNVGEIFQPVTTGLDNAQSDPCSIVNVDNIDAALTALCISTGMSMAQVGQVQNVISGQVNVFSGADPENLPGAETADTTTAGIVWTPDTDLVDGLTISVDYYDVDITDIIGEFSAQEVLDGCYVMANPAECSKINRIGGDLTISGSGLDRFTTNLDYLQAEGVDIGFSFSLGLGEWGDLRFSGNITRYLTQESQSSGDTPVIDCKGYFGTSCDPLSDTRWTQRTTWSYEAFTVSLLWRHINSVDIQKEEAADVFPAFHKIDSYDYFDLYASYTLDWKGEFTLALGVENLTDEDPPVVGGEVGQTSFNSGNTFPSNYSTLGTIYSASLNYKF